MRNIFLIPTDKPSRLGLCNNKLTFLLNHQNILVGHKNYPTIYQNIYITSDEEIKEGDWLLIIDDFETYVHEHKGDNLPTTYCKKIILTTDQDLINDGVQAIDDKFLQWFVKNPSLEFVEIKNNWEFLGDDYRRGGEPTLVYKTIIPKQEPLNLKKLESKLDNALSKETTESLTDWLNSKRDKQEPNFYEKLKEYFENTPREKVLEDWNKSAHLDNVGPTIDEFIENSNEERLKENGEKWSLNSAKEFALSYFKKSDEVSSKGMFTYELLLRILEAGIECGYKFGTKRQDEKRYTYDELRRIAYNAYCLGQLEEPTENKYNLWIQQFKNK
jgi:hypothetical protein